MLHKIQTLFCIGVVLVAALARNGSAQDSTSGAIRGTVTDSSTGQVLSGVTVVVTSNSRGNGTTAITDENGNFKIDSLSPGDYSVLFSFAGAKTQMPNVRVNIGRSSRLLTQMDISSVGETVVIKGRPNIDTTRTTQGVVIDRDFLENLPVPGLSFESALGAAAGSQNDGVGVSFSGSSSLENQYVIDGVNTTGLSYGTVGSPVINEFIDEIEVITGGYMAEYGRSTGGVVNVVTQSGSNEFHGAVFSYYTGALLQRRNQRTPLRSYIDLESQLSYDMTLGARLGGPIIKDKLWFFVGLAPRFTSVKTDRITKSRTDCRERLADGEQSTCDPSQYADGVADEDETGFPIYEDLDRSTLSRESQEYQFISKINYSPNSRHSGQVSFSGTPVVQESAGVTGEPQAVSRNTQLLTTDISAKWTAKFNDAKTTLVATTGFHREALDSGSIDSAADNVVRQQLRFGNFGVWARGMNEVTGQPRESTKTISGCADDVPSDRFPGFANCPDEQGIGYSVGGIGVINDIDQSRFAGQLSVIQRIKAAGDHEIKLGVDLERNFSNQRRLLSGNALITQNQNVQLVQIFRFVSLQPEGDESDNFGDVCDRLSTEDSVTGVGGPQACDYTPQGDVKTRTRNIASYVQDSWQILPNLTVNAGLRYEEQRLRNADHLVGTRAQRTGQLLGKNAMLLRNMWAPRIGALYDWTREGRSKVYGSWGRYYESIPLDINNRSFGAEANQTTSYNSASCGPVASGFDGPDGTGCLGDVSDPPAIELLSGSGVLVANGVRAQFLDETILGIEYEVKDDLKIGFSLQNRKLGRVLEDLSTDNAQTYVLANPGDWSEANEKDLEARIEGETDAAEKVRLETQLEQFRGIRKFDKARRDYNAVTATVSNRFSRQLYVQSSYTFSRTKGNYQGLFSSTNGQIDPNVTSLFDLPELMANNEGPLPQDRPHLFRFDGYYSFDLQKAGEVVTGLSFSALSGTPISATAAHYRYGQSEAKLLPRGTLGRTDFNYNASIHVGYQRNISNSIRLEAFFDVFNVNAFGFLGGQGTATVDNQYTFSNANPVAGGRYDDLVFVKELDIVDGSEPSIPLPVNRNGNFRRATFLYNPPSARLGARLVF